MPLFGGLFRSKDSSKGLSKSKNQPELAPTQATRYPPWQDSWDRKVVNTEEIHELVHLATQQVKSRDLDAPFFLLPFRPDSDISSTSSARNFVCQYFKAKYEHSGAYSGTRLSHELLLTEPQVLCSILKWCWSRLPGGVVTWDTYEMFRIGEQDSNMAMHSFDTFIPLSVESEARKQIIFNFFDLLAAVSARGKKNGLGGRKLSRLAGWWAFELSDNGKGFDGGYTSWSNAANACSHLFFAYLRSLSPENPEELSGISPLPRSLQALLSQTEYPPQTPALMHSTTPKVVMIVDSVSPTPFALLRRTKHFEYRDDDSALQQFSTFEDPVRALTDECRRVLEAISSTNQSDAQIGAADSTWSRFQNSGFAQSMDNQIGPANGSPLTGPREFHGMRTEPGSRQNDFGRPTTPSWADFLTTGFSEDSVQRAGGPVLLPPDKQLPPIGETARVRSSQSHMVNGYSNLEPGELASIGRFELDDTFWWVWITSLAREETATRKAVFGRCALIEVQIPGSKWLLVEEQIKGASPGPEKDAYIAEKKSKFSFSKRTRLGRRKSTGKKPQEPYSRTQPNTPAVSKLNISQDQHSRIQQAAAQLAQGQKQKSMAENNSRRGRHDDTQSTKTNSVMTLQPAMLSAAAPAMKWAKEFDKDSVRTQYMHNKDAGTGKPVDRLDVRSDSRGDTFSNGFASPAPSISTRNDTQPPSSPSAPVSRKAVAAPLPVTPNGSTTPRPKADAGFAAQIPLPDDKIASPTSQPDLSQHPAYRSESTENARPPVPPKKDEFEVADEKAWEKPQVPEEKVAIKKDSPKKLKKTAGPSGFKRMFGKSKKLDKEQNRSETPLPPAKKETLPAPPQKDEAPPYDAYETRPAEEDRLVEPRSTVVASSRAIPPSPAVEAVANGHNVDKPYDAQPPQSQFNQGPLDDVPAFIPDDSGEDSPALPTHPATYEEPKPQVHEEAPVSPVYQSEKPVVPDNQSEQSIELQPQISPSDRWAQIRKNAAERAARQSEEKAPSQSQSQRTDEGETSGEETIEHRVARIKARVAELTGKMDAQGNIKTTTR